jgi:hypothetical protein
MSSLRESGITVNASDDTSVDDRLARIEAKLDDMNRRLFDEDRPGAVPLLNYRMWKLEQSFEWLNQFLSDHWPQKEATARKRQHPN